MRSKLFATCLFVLSLSAVGCKQKPQPQPDAFTVTPITWGSIHTTTSSGGDCAWTIDGKSYGTNNGFTTVLSEGFHPVTCSRASDGFTSTQNVTVIANKTTDVRMWLPIQNGELVAVSVGTRCTFAVNGAAKGTSGKLELSLPPGNYEVSCKPIGGLPKTRSVIIKSGETAMAMFKWEA